MSITIKRLAPGVYEIFGADEELTIEKQYGDWRIINDRMTYTFSWPTLKEAVKWLMSDLKRKGHI